MMPAKPAAPKPRALTGKQQAFLKTVISNGFKVSAAYRKVYNSKASPPELGRQAQRLANHTLIAPQIAAAKAKLVAATERVVEKAVITREKLAENLAMMSTYDIRGAFDWKGGKSTLRDSADLPADVVMAMTGVEIKSDGSLKLSFVDKRAATVDLARLRGWVIERKEQRVVNGWDDLSTDEVKKLAGDDDPEPAERP